jgi:hypothetical protein
MIIYINKKKVELFGGAIIKDAIRAYSASWYKKLEEGKARVYDRYGNSTEPDGELTDKQVIYIKKI